MPGENEQENGTTQTNGTITEEKYNQLKGELESERARVTEQVALATQPLTERIASLEEQLRTTASEAEQQKATAEEKDKGFASLSAQHEGAVSAYRDLVLRSNPLLPADMITGATIEEVNAAVKKANGIIGQVKEGLEKQTQQVTQQTTIPAGSPGRTPADLSNMTTMEKINYGLDQAKKK
jgi:hypothetical protein